MKKVFKELDLVGWYTTGPKLTQNHVAIHEVMGSDPTIDNEVRFKTKQNCILEITPDSLNVFAAADNVL